MLARLRRAALGAAAALACACAAPSPTPRAAAAPSPEREPQVPGARATAPTGTPGTAASDGPASTAEDEEEDDESEEESVDDVEAELPPDATIAPPHPLDRVSNEEVDRRVASALESLGPMSIGKPNAGRLLNGAAMPEGEGWDVVAPGAAFGTEEMIQALTTAISSVGRQFPNTPRLPIGDISAKTGGHLPPHLSHQSGRDADIGYYYLDGERWYRRANEKNLDLPRTWALVRAFITQTDVEMLLIDHSIQRLLRDYAERAGEDREWLQLVFKGKGAVPSLIRHAPGHATHLHVRLYSPVAQETGRRAYAALVKHGKIPVGSTYATIVAKKGDTLAKLAKRYKTTIPAIRRANGLRGSVIQAKKSYRIPTSYRAPPAVSTARVAIPPRRLPSRDPRPARPGSPELASP